MCCIEKLESKWKEKKFRHIYGWDRVFDNCMFVMVSKDKFFFLEEIVELINDQTHLITIFSR